MDISEWCKLVSPWSRVCNLEHVHCIHELFLQLTLNKHLLNGSLVNMETRFIILKLQIFCAPKTFTLNINNARATNFYFASKSSSSLWTSCSQQIWIPFWNCKPEHSCPNYFVCWQIKKECNDFINQGILW